ncbi:hypothetical protein Y024_6247 [Burkholderia pseudomallei TSV44]|nr:hypothetical protein Y024_6247 [Burkholderia pseudomallei TSV44]
MGGQLETQSRPNPQVGHPAILAVWIVGGALRHVSGVIVRLGFDCIPDFVIRVSPCNEAQTTDFQDKLLASLSEQCRCPVIAVRCCGRQYR